MRLGRGGPGRRPRAQRVGTPWKRLGLFSLLPVLSAVSPLLILPIISRATGPAGWAAVAIGQAIGVASIALVDYGWTTQGPRLLAMTPDADRRSLLTASVQARLITGTPTFVLVAVVCVLLAPAGFGAVCATVGLASAVSGLLPTWYFIASGRPSKIAVYDTAPRVLAAVLSILPVAAAGSAMPYGVILLAVTVVAVVVSTRREGESHILAVGHRPVVRKALRSGWPLASSGMISSGYTSMSVPLFALAVGGAIAPIASFAAGIRLMNMAQGGLRACTTSLQGWVTEDWGGSQSRSRMLTAVTANVAVSSVAALLLAVGLPLASTVVFGAGIEVSSAAAVCLGLALLLNGITSSLGNHVLAPSLRIRVIAASVVAASATGFVLIWIAARAWGAVGATAAVAISEFVVFAIQAPFAWRALRAGATVVATGPSSASARVRRSRERC